MSWTKPRNLPLLAEASALKTKSCRLPAAPRPARIPRTAVPQGRRRAPAGLRSAPPTGGGPAAPLPVPGDSRPADGRPPPAGPRPARPGVPPAPTADRARGREACGGRPRRGRPTGPAGPVLTGKARIRILVSFRLPVPLLRFDIFGAGVGGAPLGRGAEDARGAAGPGGRGRRRSSPRAAGPGTARRAGRAAGWWGEAGAAEGEAAAVAARGPRSGGGASFTRLLRRDGGQTSLSAQGRAPPCFLLFPSPSSRFLPSPSRPTAQGAATRDGSGRGGGGRGRREGRGAGRRRGAGGGARLAALARLPPISRDRPASRHRRGAERVEEARGADWREAAAVGGASRERPAAPGAGVAEQV